MRIVHGIVLVVGIASLGAAVVALDGTGEAEVSQAETDRFCLHEGKTYAAGEQVCVEGMLRECDGSTGEWTKLDEACE